MATTLYTNLEDYDEYYPQSEPLIVANQPVEIYFWDDESQIPASTLLDSPITEGSNYPVLLDVVNITLERNVGILVSISMPYTEMENGYSGNTPTQYREYLANTYYPTFKFAVNREAITLPSEIGDTVTGSLEILENSANYQIPT